MSFRKKYFSGKAAVVQRTYCIDVTVDELIKIMRYDVEVLLGEVEEGLYAKLEDIEGVSKVEYDGHFGPHIWFTIDVEHDHSNTWLAIEAAVNCVLLWKETIDVLGETCVKCRSGVYRETSIHDDKDGTLHCSACGVMVERHQKRGERE